MMKINENYGFDIPTHKSLWYYGLTLNRYIFMHKIYIFFLHIIPALIVDIVTYLIGRKPMYVSHIKSINFDNKYYNML